MLQRAASNAYSWWWAGHIRTKQSKWLEQSLQDMEEKVEYVLKLIQEDGDSFAKRAEMYYKKRPELINFVEEFYRAFRALAERYDSLSTELQNANTTIATCFPEQVQFDMDDEDDYNSAKNPKFNLPQGPNPNLPKVPKVPNRVLKGMITDGSKKLQPKKPTKPTNTKRTVPKSGLTKSEALEEIDKLQKDILALQTTKEFVKSSYENGISKYWGLENEIMEKQERVSRLQDEFGEGRVIDDNDARTLMAEAALKSCQETLAHLQDKQERSAEEAEAENKKIEDARQRLKSLKHEFLPDQTDDETIDENLDPGKLGEDLPSVNQEGFGPEGQKLEVLREKIKEQFEAGSVGSITVTELAEKVDDLVNKVITLEGSVSSQTVLIDRLRTEADNLQSQIRSLEDEKETLLDGTHNLKNRVREMEQKLYGVQNLNKNFINQNISLQTHFTEAHSSLDQLSVKIQNVKPDEESEVTGSSPKAEGSVFEGKPQEALAKQNKGQGEEGDDSVVNNSTSGTDEKVYKVQQNISALAVKNQKGEGKEADGKSNTSQVPKIKEEAENKEEKKDSSQTIEKPVNVEPQESEIEKAKEFGDELNWQQMLLNGLEDKEKILLTEYTTILRNYKEVKKKLSEEQKKNDTLFETAVQVRDLKSAVSKKDLEIQSLRHKLNLLQGEPGGVPEANDSAEKENLCTPPTEEEEAEIKFLINQPQTISPIEEKLRGKIDAILDENLEFWLRFSTVFHQVQKFKTEVQDLQAEILQSKEKEAKKQEGKSSTSLSADLKADVWAVYKHLTEKKIELTVWLEQSESLKDELQRRFSSICTIQEDITAALKEGVEEEEITFSSHQAAKLHGEVLNMKQENNKVNEELLAGIDHITTLRIESEKTLAKLDANYGLSESKPALRSGSRSRIPLRSFIFGIKAKKQKQSIFSYMQHSKKASS